MRSREQLVQISRSVFAGTPHALATSRQVPMAKHVAALGLDHGALSLTSRHLVVPGGRPSLKTVRDRFEAWHETESPASGVPPRAPSSGKMR